MSDPRPGVTPRGGTGLIYLVIGALSIGIAATEQSWLESFYGAIVGGFALGLGFATAVDRYWESRSSQPRAGRHDP